MSLTKGKNTKWNDEILIKVTHMARDGLTESQMARMLGISKITFTIWEKDNRLFRKAVQEGRAYTKRGQRGVFDMSDYIYRRLSSESQTLWRQIHAFDNANKGLAKVNALLAGRGKRIRQDMFLCAWVNGLFSVSAACRKIGVNRNTFERWKREPYFQRMVWEVEQIRNDLYENCVSRGALAGDPTILTQIMNSKLKDRGYGKPTAIDINVQGQIEHSHRLVLMEDLNLPISVQKIILDRVRTRRKLVASTTIDNDQEDNA